MTRCLSFRTIEERGYYNSNGWPRSWAQDEVRVGNIRAGGSLDSQPFRQAIERNSNAPSV
jgi:hypothetical protein